MSRFHLRRKLRKVCSKAKYIAVAFSSPVKRSTMKVGTIVLMGIASVGVASPSQAAVINGDFETNLAGWQTIGNTSVINGKASLSNDGGVSVQNIAAFLGLNPGSLNALNNVNATIGSAIKQTIAVNAGDTLSFDWQFQAGDYLPYNDFSFYTINSAAFGLADVLLVGDYGQITSQTSYKFQTTGTYTIGFGVVNAIDNALFSNLAIDNARVQPVPEPITILGSLTAAGVGTALRRKYKQKQKETAEV